VNGKRCRRCARAAVAAAKKKAHTANPRLRLVAKVQHRTREACPLQLPAWLEDKATVQALLEASGWRTESGNQRMLTVAMRHGSTVWAPETSVIVTLAEAMVLCQ
jgi:hypothetical protein